MNYLDSVDRPDTVFATREKNSVAVVSHTWTCQRADEAPLDKEEAEDCSPETKTSVWMFRNKGGFYIFNVCYISSEEKQVTLIVDSI